jgi:hypothetical protein
LKIASSALDHGRCIARAAESPDGNDASFTVAFLNLKDNSFRTQSHTRVVTAVFKGECCARYDLGSTRASAMNVAQFAVIPQHRTRR